jgi:putative colanic acid biosynthesis glycosyltransferase
MISVVTVVRNDLTGIQKTYQSLIAQSNQEYEWVVIDAVSTDGTVEFVKSLIDKRIVFLSEKDKGIYDGMNKGISLSKGDYIFFLNAGDFLYDNSVLENIAQFVRDNEYDIIYGAVAMRIGGNVYKRFPKKSADSVKHTLPGHHQATFYNRKAIQKFNYDLKYEFSGDYYLAAKLYYEGYRNYYFSDSIIAEFEVGHHSYKNLFKIWKYSNDIQNRILGLSFFARVASSFKRFISSILIVFYFQISKFIRL